MSSPSTDSTRSESDNPLTDHLESDQPLSDLDLLDEDPVEEDLTEDAVVVDLTPGASAASETVPSPADFPPLPPGVLWEKRTRLRGSEVLIRGLEDPDTSDGQGPTDTAPQSGTVPSRTAQKSDDAQAARTSSVKGSVEPLPAAGSLQMLLRRVGDQHQAVLLEGPVVVEHHSERPSQRSLVGNLYLGVVTAVVESLEAIFVDIGTGSHGILRPKAGLKGISAGDRMMVRVIKDAYGSKGPKLKEDLSLTGRYLVLLASTPGRLAVSSHLTADQRAQLRQTLSQLSSDGVIPSDVGVIARSNAAEAPVEALVEDLNALLARWSEIEALDSAEGDAPRLLYGEPDLPLRMVREHLTPSYRRLITDDIETFNLLRDYLRETAPDLADKLELHDASEDLFTRFHVFDQLHKALARTVHLPSGGHLVIDRTEALTAIDVNTGKFNPGGSSHADTVFVNNLEAAEEAARQIRLRDIGGIIIIDFIDMDSSEHRDEVLSRFRRGLARDRTTSDIFTISELGLVEMSRKRRANSFLETVSDACPHCDGRGVTVKADDKLLTPHDDNSDAATSSDSGRPSQDSRPPRGSTRSRSRRSSSKKGRS